MPSRRLLDVGLAFEVAGTLGITVREFWRGLPQTAVSLFFIPVRVRVARRVSAPWFRTLQEKILVASLLAASMGPAGLAISAAATGTPVGRPLDDGGYFLTSSYPCAILAFLIARVVHRFNQRLNDAREIGSYELYRWIGAGGMGEAWRAQHPLLARSAAIKLIRSPMLGESGRAREVLVRRFKREARATVALASTHTIHVYDFGITEDGSFYYVMELLEGLSLSRLVHEFGPVAPAAPLLLRQVCHSLEEAHARGLVHRDIKPANIMVCRLGHDHDFINLLDFGLVSHTDAGQTVTMLSLERTCPEHQATWRRKSRSDAAASTGAPTSTRSAVSRITC